MSDTRVPITDAFDDTDELEALPVKLTPEQVEWLQEKAEEQGVSVDHMLRTLLNAQMRDAEDTTPLPSQSGDGAPQSTTTPTSADARSADDDTSQSDTDTPSIVESLRSASERLHDLTEEEEESESTHDLDDTLSRLRARVGSTSSDDTNDEPGNVLMDESNQSMFDMVD